MLQELKDRDRYLDEGKKELKRCQVSPGSSLQSLCISLAGTADSLGMHQRLRDRMRAWRKANDIADADSVLELGVTLVEEQMVRLHFSSQSSGPSCLIAWPA